MNWYSGFSMGSTNYTLTIAGSQEKMVIVSMSQSQVSLNFQVIVNDISYWTLFTYYTRGVQPATQKYFCAAQTGLNNLKNYRHFDHFSFSFWQIVAQTMEKSRTAAQISSSPQLLVISFKKFIFGFPIKKICVFFQVKNLQCWNWKLQLSKFYQTLFWNQSLEEKT
jgi:hypothetical protein